MGMKITKLTYDKTLKENACEINNENGTTYLRGNMGDIVYILLQTGLSTAFNTTQLDKFSKGYGDIGLISKPKIIVRDVCEKDGWDDEYYQMFLNFFDFEDEDVLGFYIS